MTGVRRTASDRVVAAAGSSFRLLLAVALFCLVVPPVALGVGGITLLRAPLPGELPDRRPTFDAVPSRAYDADGNQIAVFRGFDRTVDITPDDIPDVLVDAVVAIEDQRFFEHRGIDLEGIARAARVNLELGEIAQGGSTITQQYVKNAYLGGERTFERKFREALLATELENRMDKDEILFRYLESSYFGAGAYGVGAAAEVYFAKPVSELDLSEAATIAGILQAPTRLSPRVDLEAAEDRRRLVLQAMLDQGRISEDEHRRAAGRPLVAAADGVLPGGPVTVVAAPPPKGAQAFPYFVDWIEAELLEAVGPDLLYRGGLRIETTIDPQLQRTAEAAVAARLGDSTYPVEMALVTLEPGSGRVLAMVGGRDHDRSQVNLATGGSTGFQPGSSFKPIVLAEAFRQGIGPETVYPAPADWVVPNCTGTRCTISNYDGADRGELTLREAMHDSVNTVFAELISDVSVTRTRELAESLGLGRLDADVAYGPSLALGSGESSTLEMASAYGTFANRGVRVSPVGVLRVLDPEGRVLLDATNRVGTRVLDQAVADNVTDVLVGVVTEGTGGRAAVPGHVIAGKTGTGQAYRAAWFVGYTPDVATAVWMGHADALRPLRDVNGVGNVTGGSHPAIAFAEVMAAALADRAPRAFPEPAELLAPDTADDIVPVRDEVLAGLAGRPTGIDSTCGSSCRLDLVPAPDLTPPPVTTPPPPSTTSTTGTTVPPTSADGTTTTTTPSTTSATSTTTTASTGSTTGDGG